MATAELGEDERGRPSSIDREGSGGRESVTSLAQVLSANYAGYAAMWYENNGAQSFAGRLIEDYGTYVPSVEATDIDGDGDVDVLPRVSLGTCPGRGLRFCTGPSGRLWC